MSFSAISSTHTTVTDTATTQSQVPSIRDIIRTGLLHGRHKDEIAALVREYHPTSAAAAKSGKHIAWYKAQMKKAGELPA